MERLRDLATRLTASCLAWVRWIGKEDLLKYLFRIILCSRVSSKMDEAVIGAMDFGMVGHLDQRDRENLVRLYIVSVQLDTEGIMEQPSGRYSISSFHRGLDRHAGTDAAQDGFQRITSFDHDHRLGALGGQSLGDVAKKDPIKGTTPGCAY